MFYDTTLGVTYWQNILGQNPPLAYIKAQLVKAALTVPGVASAVCYISSTANREVQGQLQITTTTGLTSVVGFTKPVSAPGDAAITDTGILGVTDTGLNIVTDPGQWPTPSPPPTPPTEGGQLDFSDPANSGLIPLL